MKKETINAIYLSPAMRVVAFQPRAIMVGSGASLESVVIGEDEDL